jgi:adenylate kinase family enzyme
MRRILVVGSGGSGKSTLSRRLGNALKVPVIHLDSLYWKPGWIEPNKAERTQTIRRVIAERIEACDTIVFLDLSRLICLWRVLRRLAAHRGKARPEMPDGCPERLNIGFLWWIWTYPARTRRKVLALLEKYRSTKNVIYLRTRQDVERFVGSQRATS